MLLPTWNFMWYSKTQTENSVEPSQFCSFPWDYKVRENIWSSEQNLHSHFNAVVWTCLYPLVWKHVLHGFISFFPWAEAWDRSVVGPVQSGWAELEEDGELWSTPGWVLLFHCESLTYFKSKGLLKPVVLCLCLTWALKISSCHVLRWSLFQRQCLRRQFICWH